MSGLLQWLACLTPTLSGSGLPSSPAMPCLKESPDGVRWDCYSGSLCESAVSAGRGFPWDNLKVGCVAQSKLKLIQQERPALLADVIFLLSYKLPEGFTSSLWVCVCVCISASTSSSWPTFAFGNGEPCLFYCKQSRAFIKQVGVHAVMHFCAVDGKSCVIVVWVTQRSVSEGAFTYYCSCFL